MSRSTGIEVRHARGCPAANDKEARCRCRPSYRASVWSKRDGRRIRETFPTLAAARAWRHDTSGAVRRGEKRAADGTTVREAWETLAAEMESGVARTRSGDVYKPSATRSYSEAMRLRVLPELGARRLTDVTRADVQLFVDRLAADGLDASTIRNTLLPLRVVYRRAIRRGQATVTPCANLELPRVEGRRDRIAAPDEAARILAALPDDLRPVWAVALYAGLRRGEVLALRVEDVDLDTGVIRVERSWDPTARRYGAPKSDAGKRNVPIAAVLRELLVGHLLRTGRRTGLLFGDGERPLDPRGIARRAATAWKGAGVVGIGLHECRHTFASTMLAAGVGARVIAELMGHADAGLVWTRYSHLLPDAPSEAVAAFDAYQAQAAEAQGRH
jgi:integrase